MKFTALFKEKEIKKECPYNSPAECNYESHKKCGFLKESCHRLNERPKRKNKSTINSRIIIFVLIGLLGYIVFSILSYAEDLKFSHSDKVYFILSNISMSVVTGGFLAILIDLPSRLKDYEKSFINTLTSNDYLKSLDELKLTNLRNEITRQLHKTKAPNMAHGLIKIDQRVCELLRLPYYTRYRHTVICTSAEQSDFVKKEHTMEYKLINPYGHHQKSTEFIKFTNYILLGEGESANNIFTDLKIQCRLDNNEILKYEVGDNLEILSEKIEEQEFYNTKVYFKESGSNIENGIRVDFNDNIEVKINYKIKVPINDPCFTKRLQRPTKNFRLDYTCNIPDTKLYGQIFGTDIKQPDVSIQYNGNSISLETFDWLLPENGAIVVMLKN